MTELKNCIQNQWWFHGGGVSVVLAVNWAKQMKIYPGSHGYLTVWMLAGKIAQHIIHISTVMGYSLRVTPALSDSKVKHLLFENSEYFPVYYLRIGEEHNHLIQSYIDSFENLPPS